MKLAITVFAFIFSVETFAETKLRDICKSTNLNQELEIAIDKKTFSMKSIFDYIYQPYPASQNRMDRYETFSLYDCDKNARFSEKVVMAALKAPRGKNQAPQSMSNHPNDLELVSLNYLMQNANYNDFSKKTLEEIKNKFLVLEPKLLSSLHVSFLNKIASIAPLTDAQINGALAFLKDNFTSNKDLKYVEILNFSNNIKDVTMALFETGDMLTEPSNKIIRTVLLNIFIPYNTDYYGSFYNMYNTSPKLDQLSLRGHQNLLQFIRALEEIDRSRLMNQLVNSMGRTTTDMMPYLFEANPQEAMGLFYYTSLFDNNVLKLKITDYVENIKKLRDFAGMFIQHTSKIPRIEIEKFFSQLVRKTVDRISQIHQDLTTPKSILMESHLTEVAFNLESIQQFYGQSNSVVTAGLIDLLDAFVTSPDSSNHVFMKYKRAYLINIIFRHLIYSQRTADQTRKIVQIVMNTDVVKHKVGYILISALVDEKVGYDKSIYEYMKTHAAEVSWKDLSAVVRLISPEPFTPYVGHEPSVWYKAQMSRWKAIGYDVDSLYKD